MNRGGYMDDDEDDGYRKVSVEHDGPEYPIQTVALKRRLVKWLILK